MDPAMNDIFQKPVINAGSRGGTTRAGHHAYYPSSQEYGFMTKRGNRFVYIEGLHFMREGANESAGEASSAIIDTFMKEVEAEWRK